MNILRQDFAKRLEGDACTVHPGQENDCLTTQRVHLFLPHDILGERLVIDND
jgi:hypothetical protein